MDLFIVVDIMGAGRVVGVFNSKAAAQHVIGEFPAYYQLHQCKMNRVDPEALAWALNDAQRQWLRGIIDLQSK